MFSILISTYNQDPGNLVRDLLIQLNKLDKPFEIIIGNDASDSKFMPIFSSLGDLPGVNVFHAEKNLGRSGIRNAIAKHARYPYLIFIDGDAEVRSDDFISKYMEKAEPGRAICGGTAYQNTPPLKKEELLRWKYGVRREAITSKQRNIEPYSGFSSFNFLISAEAFKNIGFNEQIVRYGHEDTIFGIELERNNISILHIDNQLIHNGLDSAELFLKKTRESVHNLSELLNTYEYPEYLISHIRLLNKYYKLRKYGFHLLIGLVNIVAIGPILRNLKGSSPSLALLDLYKLCILHKNQA